MVAIDYTHLATYIRPGDQSKHEQHQIWIRETNGEASKHKISTRHTRPATFTQFNLKSRQHFDHN